MMVAVDTISDENISVSGTLPNSSAGARICTWISANNSAELVENAVDHPEKGDADIIEIAFHGVLSPTCGSSAEQQE